MRHPETAKPATAFGEPASEIVVGSGGRNSHLDIETPTTLQGYADPREVFLARASARDRLFVSGDMDLDEAIDGLVDALYRLRPCACMQESFKKMMKPLQHSRGRAS